MTKYTEPTFKAIQVKGEDILTASTPVGPNEAGFTDVTGSTNIVDGDDLSSLISFGG